MACARAWIAAAVAIAGVCGVCRAQQAVTFQAPSAIAGWTVSGDVKVDASMDRGGGGGSLRVGPGGKAVWKLRDADGAGQVEMWVYEDQTKAAKPKERHVGPRWGLIQSDGRVLVVGVLHAPYLAGDTTYSASDSDQKNWFNVQYLAVPRKPGWHKWTFDFDPEKGLTILYLSLIHI